MKKNKKTERKYRSFEEYQKKNYPSLFKKELEAEDDPSVFAVSLAKESLKKLDILLSRQ